MDPIPTPTPLLKQPAFVISLMLIPLAYIVTFMVLLPGNGYSTEVKVMVIAAVVGVLTAITGYWLASSFGSDKKTDAIVASAKTTESPPPGTITRTNTATLTTTPPTPPGEGT